MEDLPIKVGELMIAHSLRRFVTPHGFFPWFWG